MISEDIGKICHERGNKDKLYQNNVKELQARTISKIDEHEDRTALRLPQRIESGAYRAGLLQKSRNKPLSIMDFGTLINLIKIKTFSNIDVLV